MRLPGSPSGSTRERLARLVDVLAQLSPDPVIFGHGGNDLLRKRDLDNTKRNLRRMVELVRASGASVVLLGVPNPGLFLGTHPPYRELAEELELPIEDEALPDILGDPSLKSDQLHPNAQGDAKLADAIQDLLRETGALN